MPNMANNMGNVFGGVILSLVDRVAAVAATRHARRPCVTVSVDQVDFKEPIYLGELVTAQASVNFTGRTSMEVGVRIESENLLTGKRRWTNSCYVTYVAVDERGKPTKRGSTMILVFVPFVLFVVKTSGQPLVPRVFEQPLRTCGVQPKTAELSAIHPLVHP